MSRGEIGWSPDGKSIAFSGPSGLYLLALDNSAVRRVTVPPPAAEDWGPAFSPDGDSVMFVRSQIGVPDDIGSFLPMVRSRVVFFLSAAKLQAHPSGQSTDDPSSFPPTALGILRSGAPRLMLLTPRCRSARLVRRHGIPLFRAADTVLPTNA